MQLGIVGLAQPRPRNTSRLDDVPRSPTYSALDRAGIPWSGVRRRFLPDVAARTVSSGLPDLDKRDSRNYSAIRDTFDETDRGCAENHLRRCPVLRASACDGTRPALPLFPH